MKLKFKLATAIALITLVPGLAFSTQPLETSPAAGTTPPAKRTIAATVNEQPIYEDQLTPLIESGLSKHKKFDPSQLTAETRARIRSQALEKVITTELFVQAGKALKIKDFDTLVAKALAEIKNHPSGKMQQRSDEDLRNLAVRQVYISEYMKANGLLNPEVPEEEIKALYEKNKEGLIAKENALTRHILVQVPQDATAEQKKVARDKIEQARQKILDGAPFDEVAREYSEDKNASSGGDLGYMESNYMPPEFDAVAFTIEPGKTSEIIETRFGFHVLQVLERNPQRYIPYETTRDFMKKYLQNKAAQKNRDSHIRQLREKARIEIFEPVAATPTPAPIN